MKRRALVFTITLVSLMIAAAAVDFSWALASGTWAARAPLPETRVFASSGVIAGKLYVAGGSDQFGNKPLTTLRYDPSADSWSFTAGTMHISPGRSNMASGVIGGKLYAAEGWINSDSSSSTTAMEVYDPVTDAWSFGPNSLVARGNSAKAVIDDKLYVTGGAASGLSVVFNQLEVFDPAAETWSLLAPIPLAFAGSGGAAIGGKFYVVGGYSPSLAMTRSDLQIYDPATNTWTLGPPMPTPRSEPFVDVIGGKLYVVGGNDNILGPRDAVEVFDPTTNTWSTEASAPTARSGAVGGVVGTTLYVTGGYYPYRVETEAFTADAPPTPDPTPVPTPTPSPTPYNFIGFFQPVDNLPTLNVANAGRVIPVKFSLSGYQGLGIVVPGYPASGQITCNANEPGSEIEETANAGGSTLTYDAAADQYTYVWRTERTWQGTCRILVVRLSDGTDHFAKFRFR